MNNNSWFKKQRPFQGFSGFGGGGLGLSFGGGLKYQIPRGPIVKVDYVLTDFGVFKNVEGYSISLTF